MKNTKRITLALLIVSVVSLPLFAAEKEETAPKWSWNQGFSWHLGADATTNYLLRAWNYGGLAFQPHGSISYAGATVAAWANIGAKDWAFEQFNPQLNITLSYSLFGLTVGVTHLHYFSSAYFDFKGKTYEEYINNTGNWNQTELFATYQAPDFFPIRLSWYTYIAGNDMFPDIERPIKDGDEIVGYEMKRTFSTYIELAYKFKLPMDFILTPAVGISPWKGYYTRNEGNFALKNIEFRVERPHQINEHCSYNVYAVLMLDCYKVTKKNLITTIDNTWSNQRLNLAIGTAINFY